MAKYGVINIAGGGGIGSDEISVTKEYVLDGKTYVGADTDDEIGIGKMANNGTTANQNLNADSSFYIKKGYHEKDFTVNANSLASQTSATALMNQIISGKTAWVNGKKITGTIPIQNSDTDGDRVWATNASNWAGTFNVGVRNGHYLNGVNWVRYDVPTYRPENIKKGVNIGGVVGTFEGYVPTPSDLYLRGSNYAGFVPSRNDYYTFDAGQITARGSGFDCYIYTPSAYNLTPYRGIAVEYWGTGRLYISVNKENASYAQTGTCGSVEIYPEATVGTLYLDISAINVNAFIHIVKLGGSIYRIWLY
jgi:hypothetical protein